MRTADIIWSQPLCVTLPSGERYEIESVQDALDFFDREWVLDGGNFVERAIMLCHSALQRTVPSSVTREAIIRAFLEAGAAVSTKPLLARHRKTAVEGLELN